MTIPARPRTSRCLRRIVLGLTALGALAAAPAPQAGEQADRALAAIRTLRAAGKIPDGTALRMGFKQGNVYAYLGRNLELQKEWEEQTGILIETRIIPQLPALQIIKANPQLDLTVARNHEFPELLALGLIEDLTPRLSAAGFHLDDDRQRGYIRPDLQAYVGGRVAAIPADGDVLVMYLRGDLMRDPAERAAFRKATGRDLAPPQTWEEYDALVAYFHRPERGLYGTTEERDPEGAWMFWLPRFLSLASKDGDPYLFDEHMRSRLSTPAGVQATEHYVATVRYSPPEITGDANNYSYTLPFLLQGKVFANIATLSSVRLLNTAQSQVSSKFEIHPIPGIRRDGAVQRRNTVIYGNNLVIPSDARNPQLALLYAMWITDAANSVRSVGVPGGFTDPYRWNHLADKRIREIYTPAALDIFAQAWSDALPPGTGLSGDGEYMRELDQALTEAARGKISATEAMARVTQRWEAITERYGRDRQIATWREFRSNFRTGP